LAGAGPCASPGAALLPPLLPLLLLLEDEESVLAVAPLPLVATLGSFEVTPGRMVSAIPVSPVLVLTCRRRQPSRWGGGGGGWGGGG
jgi:hypothetical protein